MTAAAAPEDRAVCWPVALAALAGGVAAAMQVGKASAAMPLLRAEFGVSLTAASAYLAAFSLGAALLGLALGLATQRAGPLRAGVVGLALLGGAGVASAFAPSWALLCLCRLVEAAGLPLVVAAMPALMQSASGAGRRSLVAGIWASWLPLGVALALALSARLLESPGGWRALFLWTGLAPLAAIALLLASRPGRPSVAPAPVPAGPRRPPAAVLGMAALFLLFSAVYLILTGLIPSVAAADLGLGLSAAAALGAGSALLVVAGNLSAALLLFRGVAPSRLLALAFAGMAGCAALFLSGGFPAGLRIAGGAAFNLAAGVAPGVIWSLVPQLSRRTGLGAAVISGTYYQAAGLGQVAGPVLAGALAQAAGGWAGSLAIVLPLALLGAWLSLRLVPRPEAAG